MPLALHYPQNLNIRMRSISSPQRNESNVIDFFEERRRLRPVAEPESDGCAGRTALIIALVCVALWGVIIAFLSNKDKIFQ